MGRAEETCPRRFGEGGVDAHLPRCGERRAAGPSAGVPSPSRAATRLKAKPILNQISKPTPPPPTHTPPPGKTANDNNATKH